MSTANALMGLPMGIIAAAYFAVTKQPSLNSKSQMVAALARHVDSGQITIADVRRLRERVGKLDSHFRQANDDIVQIVTSADKVLKRGDRIESMEFETPPAVAEALPNPLARGAAAEARLNELRGSKRGRATKSVTVRVNTSAAGRLDLTLSYTVPGASWTPAYDARITTADRAVELGYFGVVRQNTGEDWRDVALTLSTARPSLGGGPAPLTSWTLDVFTPRLPVVFGERRESGAVSASADALNQVSFAMKAAAPAERAAEVAQATVETSATSATFRIAAPTTIASDNAPQKVAVTTAKLAAAAEYLAIPKRLAAAFLTAHVTNTSAFPFLAGALNVFLDGTFVAASQLRAVQPGEKFDLALGADEGIALKRTLVKRFAEDTGLTNGGRRVTYEFLLVVQNNKKTAERIALHDQLPVSRNEKIVVKHLAPDPKDLKPDAEGLLKWTLDLKPGEKREIALKFSIDHPADINVSGLQ